MGINLQVLGSTSAGNCTVIWDNRNALLIDCGFSQKYIYQNLKDINLDFTHISGLLITHTHTDHVNKSILSRFVKEHIPIYCHKKVYKDLSKKYQEIALARKLNLLNTFSKELFTIGSFKAQAFEVPHDSSGGCFGFNIFSRSNSSKKKITVATDLGYPADTILPHFIDSDLIVIEANHDSDMLENSPRPRWLKKRITRIGHLSNSQCADLLKKVLSRSNKLPKAIILAHISQECNTNNDAVGCIKRMLGQNNYNKIKVIETHKRKANNTVSI